MPALLLVSPHSRAGKTTIAAGLAGRISAAGSAVTLTRLPGDEAAEADGQFLARLPESASSKRSEVSIIEAPAGDPNPALEANPDARVVVIASAGQAEPSAFEYARSVRERLAGVIVNRVPSKRMSSLRAEAETDGVGMLALVPEDRVLAAPAIRDVAAKLSATVEHLDDSGLRLLDRPMIATISADPGQGYFAGYGAKAVIVRSDKPDLQLAALNAGATCLITTGGLPLLSYVLERAEEDEIPLVRTSLDTISTINGIEELYGSLPFAGGDAKIKRVTELLADVNIESLIG